MRGMRTTCNCAVSEESASRKDGCGDAGPKARDQASRLVSVGASDARSSGWIDAVVADVRSCRGTGLAGTIVGRSALVAVRGVGHPSLVAVRGASASERSADLSSRTAQLAARRSPPHDRAIDSTGRPIGLPCGRTSRRAEGRTRRSGAVPATARAHRADTDTGPSCAACVLPLPPPGGDQGARLGDLRRVAFAVSAPARRGLRPGRDRRAATTQSGVYRGCDHTRLPAQRSCRRPSRRHAGTTGCAVSQPTTSWRRRISGPGLTCASAAAAPPPANRTEVRADRPGASGVSASRATSRVGHPCSPRLNADPPSEVPTAVSSGFTVWPSAGC